MWGANLAFVHVPAILAAESTTSLKNLAPYLPYVIGGVFTLGVIVVGLAMSRKQPALTPEAASGSPEELPPELRVAPNPLWSLVLPGLGLLALGGALAFVFVPLFQDISDAREDFKSAVKSSYQEAIQSATSSDFKMPASHLPEFKPISPIQPIQVPQIDMSKFQPPPPHIPQVRVDSKGMIHVR